MSRPLPQEIINEGRRLYRAGAKARSISRELGIGLGVINQYITDADLVARADVVAAAKKPVDEDAVDLPAGKQERQQEASLPEPFPESYEPHVISEPGVYGILSDSHIPYHDKTTIELFVEECRRRKVTGIILNGDMLDCHEISSFDHDPRAPRYQEELAMGVQFLHWLRNKFRDTQITYKLGNHEDRCQTYLMRRAPAMFGLEGANIETWLHFDEHRIDLVGEQRIIQLGKLNIAHGHEWKGGVTSPVNPARGLYLKARSVALCGHHHQTSEHHARDIRGFNEAAWSVGCSCFLSPKYSRQNNWNLGWALVDLQADGNFVVENKRVLNGKIV